MASAPKKSEGDYSKRDAAYALVTNDPTTSSHGAVSFVAGYPFKKDRTVGVTIGGQTFELFTTTHKAPDGPWTHGPEDDRSLAPAMVGAQAHSTRTSGRGR